MSKRRRKLAAGNRSTGGAKSSTRHDRQARAVSIRFPKFAKPLLALTGLVVAIFLGEVASRILRLAPAVRPIEVSTEQTVYKRSTNPILSYELKANYRNENADLNKSYPRTNAQGQRDIERTVEKPIGTRRIILLGDSVVEGHGIREIDDTMSRQLEMRYGDGQTEVLNFGVSGYCTLAEVELLEVKGIQFQPDLVVLVFVENDFNNFNIESFQLGSARQRSRLVHKAFVHSSLFRAVCLRLNLFDYGIQEDPVRWNQQAIGDNNVVQALPRLKALAMHHGFQTMIVIWPRFTDDEILDLHSIPESHDELVIQRLCRMHAIPTLRLSTHFKRHHGSVDGVVNPRLRYTIGDMFHPSKEGCYVAAEAIQTMLERMGTSDGSIDGGGATPDTLAYDAEAVSAASTAGRSQPTYASVYITQGAEAEAAGQLDEAVEYYRKAVQNRPDYEKTRHNLGLALCKQGKLEEGIQHLRRAIEIQPVYAEAHRNYGVALQQLRQLDESERHLREAVRIQPDFADAYNNLGFTMFVKGETDEAIVLYCKALELEPRHSEAHDNLGVVLVSRKQLDEASDHFQQAVEADAENGQAHFNRGRLFQSQGRLEEAIDSYREVLRLNPVNVGAHNNLGAALAALGRLDEAVKHYREALRINPGHVGARRNLQVILGK